MFKRLLRRRTNEDRSLQTLGNTPPVAQDEDAVGQFAALYGAPFALANRLMLALIGALFVIGGLVVLLIMLFPLKTVVPALVEQQGRNLKVTEVQASSYRPTDAMIKSELANWSEWILTLDAHLSGPNLRKAIARTRGNATNELNEFIEKEQVFRRLLKTPTLVRTPKVSEPEIVKDGLAFVFVNTTERVEGKPTEKRWRITIHYTIIPPTTSAELLGNPLGLYTTHFDLTTEVTQ